VVESTEEGFKFNHRLYRNALYSSLKGYQRRAYHGAVARVLEEMRGDVEDIAYHYYLAGKGDKALPFIRAAVERAERLHSMLEMRKLASMGAEVAREAEDLFYFLIRKAGAENVTGKVEAAERDAREALKYATTPSQRLEVFKTIASTYMRQGLYKKVLDLIEEFRDSVGEEGAFHLDMQRATVLMKFGDVQGAISLVEPHLTTDLTEKERIYLYRFYGILRSYVGDDKGAEEYYLRSLEIAERIGDLAGMSAACNNVAIIYVGRGDVVKGKEYYERALEYERAMNDLRGMSLVMINLAELLTSQGEYEKALSMFAEIMDIKERIHDLEGLGFARHGLLYTNMLLGRYPEAEEHGREALTTFEDIGFTAGRCFVRVTLSLLHSVRGEDDRAVEMAREALLLAEEMRDEEMIRSARFRLKAAGVWRGERTEDLSDGEIEGEDDALLLYVAGLKGSGKAVEALEEALSSGKPLNPDLRRFTAGLASLLKGDWEGFQSALSSMNSPYYAALLRRAEGLMR
jgi:tetratricopeptide (TPR) repeat protein